jgi:hypothetical protein
VLYDAYETELVLPHSSAPKVPTTFVPDYAQLCPFFGLKKIIYDGSTTKKTGDVRDPGGIQSIHTSTLQPSTLAIHVHL